MSLLVVIVALLLAGALGLLYFPWSGKGAVDRDALNRALYQSRLQELVQERGEDNPALVVELQRMLALSAVRNEDYPEAVAALQALLARLPEGDARREAIVRQLAQAQQQAQ
ncbi:hypothetical protein EWQ15_11740 [Klebsiella pneumoniae]|uniref:hypothetical protein n=1 Tax=Klebsiella pneumoniae TaxID=573 RepID=UPI0010AAD938|nr:hypothetical protein EWQ15_11740 [Klebsiella pneumoniae]